MIDPDATSDSRRRPDAKGGAGIVMDSVRGPFLMRVTYAFEDDAGGGTRVRNRVEGEATRFYGLTAPLMAGRFAAA